MTGIMFNLFSLAASLIIVGMASGSWLLAAPFAVFWGLGLAISIAQWWQWERRLALTLHSHHS
ncbi:MAG: hypothetical protein EPO61_06455 [Nitrospirae bacterium]|nr:MAG: hypothetical protein EPO61_06455 [Nitrospirota bacterium]